jgi:PhnB protein
MSPSKPSPSKPKAKRATKAVKPIPDGSRAITPYLIVRGGTAALAFYKKAFGAEETLRLDMGGKIGHAEMKLGDSTVMLADEHPEMGYKSPQAYGGTPVSLLFYVEDVDARVKQAVTAGAKLLRPVQDQFYGDRTGTVVDPFGHVWTIATHVEDVTPEETAKRAAELH